MAKAALDLLILAALAMPLCLDAPPAPCAPPCATGPADAAPDRLAWSLEGCRTVFAGVPVAASALQPHLPPGFRPIPFTVRGSEADATLAFDAYACASGLGLNGSVEPLTYGSVYAPVVPPADRMRANVATYFVKWDFLVPDADRRAFFESVGLPARDGAASVGPSDAFEAAVSLEGAIRFTMQGALAPGGRTFDLTFVEFTPAADGLAEWTVHSRIAGVASGSGLVRLDGPHWATGVVGTEAVVASLELVEYSVHDSEVVFGHG
jgi:hypothetical protein